MRKKRDMHYVNNGFHSGPASNEISIFIFERLSEQVRKAWEQFLTLFNVHVLILNFSFCYSQTQHFLCIYRAKLFGNIDLRWSSILLYI